MADHSPEELAGWLETIVLPPVQVTLPSGRGVHVTRLRRADERWPDPIPRVSSCWAPNKPALNYEGMITWAEFVIVRQLEKHGWQGRWIKNWGGGRQFCEAVGRVAPASPPGGGATFSSVQPPSAGRLGVDLEVALLQ